MKVGWGQTEWRRVGGRVKSTRVHFIPIIINGTGTVWHSMFQFLVDFICNHSASRNGVAEADKCGVDTALVNE